MKVLTGKQVAIASFLATIIIELITVILRFGFKLESTRDTASTVGVLTGGIRIHHGYIGVLVLVLGTMCFKAWPSVSRWMLVAGIALVCSDLIHHFAVLWPIVGSPEFHFVY